MAFGDVLAGFGEAAHQHAVNLLQMQQQSNLENSRLFAQMSQNPDLPDEARSWLMQGALAHANAANDPKTAKQFDIKDNAIRIPVQKLKPSPIPAPIQAPGSPGTPATSPEGVPQAATQAIEPQTIQPPTPPPTMQTSMQSPFQMMPFEQRMSRLGQESQEKAAGQYGIAGMKAGIPKKVDAMNIQGEDGRRYKEDIYQYRNPVNGQMEQFNIRQDAPLAFFAPRSGATDTVANLARLSEQYGFPVNGPDGKPLDIQRLAKENPAQLLQHIGEDRYIPTAERKELRNIGGYETPYGPISGTTGAPVGMAAGSLPTNRQVTVPMPGGKLGTTTLTTTRGTQAPQSPSFVPGAPIPPLGQSSTGAPTAPPQAKPQGTAVPTAPPNIKPLPGAGHGLTAEQLMTTGKQAEAYQNTIERAVNVLHTFNTIPNIQSLLERAKLSIVTDPSGLAKIVIGNQNLTGDEAKFASDYISLSEDVNVLRGIYQATGFRGKEALEVLLGQRGKLLANPKVFTGVLKNTLQSIVTQLEPMAQTLSENGRPLTVTEPIATAYKYLNNNDAATARKKAMAAKFQLPQ